ncbi:MAG: hypothetical protein ACOYK8_10340 [Alphaproteobacteria bacterium]
MFGVNTCSYEVLVKKNQLWNVYAVFTQDEQNTAINFARDLVLDGKTDAVRVVRSVHTRLGQDIRLEVFRDSWKKTQTSFKITGDGKGLPVCQTVDELLAFQSRWGLSRILRDYLTKNQITVTELLHVQLYQKKAESQNKLISNVVSRISNAQAQEMGQDVKARGEEIICLLEILKRKTTKVTEMRPKLPRFDPRQLDELSGTLERHFGENDKDFAFLSLLSEYLMGSKTLAVKLEHLSLMAIVAPAGKHKALFDGIIADCLSFPSLVADVFPASPNRASGLFLLADFITCRLKEHEIPEYNMALKALYRLHRYGSMEQSLEMLLHRLVKEVGSARMLDDRIPDHEASLFEELIKRVRYPDGSWIGGNRMIEAMAEQRQVHRQRMLSRRGIHDSAAAFAKKKKTPPSNIADKLS